MPTVRYVTDGGSVQEIEGNEGESLMHVAVRNGVPGIEGECGGELSCATCHVYVDSEWVSKLRPPSQDEEELLESVEDVRDDSRLGCQIRLSAEIDGIVAKVVS